MWDLMCRTVDPRFLEININAGQIDACLVFDWGVLKRNPMASRAASFATEDRASSLTDNICHVICFSSHVFFGHTSIMPACRNPKKLGSEFQEIRI